MIPGFAFGAVPPGSANNMVFSPGIPLRDFLAACELARTRGYKLLSEDSLAAITKSHGKSPVSIQVEALAGYLIARFCKNKSAAEELI